MTDIASLLVIPHLYIQNANAVSSPTTWGFPSMSAFVGLMHALERRLPESMDLEFQAVGVICHHFEAQATEEFPRAFRLTRNPVGKDGSTAAIVEEGRVHLEVTLIFAVRGQACSASSEERFEVAGEIADLIAGMRIAGGSVMPSLQRRGKSKLPQLIPLADDDDERNKQFRKLKYSLLPGFALVLRDDLLQSRLAEMRETDSEVTALDAWLDLSRLNMECRLVEASTEKGEVGTDVQWEARRSRGWVVPIPIGYGALSELLSPGSVANARDTGTRFRFVESLYSIGQWLSPHRLQSPQDFLWYVENDLDKGVYRLGNRNHMNTTAQ